jgi:hypothetical protein
MSKEGIQLLIRVKHAVFGASSAERGEGTFRAHDDVIKRETTRNAEMPRPQVRSVIDATCQVSATRMAVPLQLPERQGSGSPSVRNDGRP